MLYILACLFGVIWGNFATTAIHRVPLGKPISGNLLTRGIAPHCAKCYTPLQWYEYLPITSLISTLGSCNYCGVKIPLIYLITEMLFGVVAVVLYHFLSFSFSFILILIGLVFIYSYIIICYIMKKGAGNAISKTNKKSYK